MQHNLCFFLSLQSSVCPAHPGGAQCDSISTLLPSCGYFLVLQARNKTDPEITGLEITEITALEVGEGNGPPLQYSCLENPMDGGAWWAAVHGVAKSRTRLSNFTFTFHFHPLEKEMATDSSILAWRIPGTEEAGGLPSMGSHRVGHG